jgi:ferredoxin
VQEGQELLESPELDERQLLSDFALDNRHRFACVARLRKMAGTLRIKAVEP